MLCVPLLALAFEGRVTDAVNGRPVAGATVTANGMAVTTDADGHYQLQSTTQHVQARAVGYQRTSVTWAGDSSQAPLIRLVPLRPKALYLSVYGAGNPAVRDAALKLLSSTELNALVIDIKGDRGLVPYPSAVAQAAQCGARSLTTVQDMGVLVALLKEQGIYLIARIVAFKDDLLAQAHPEWSVKAADGSLFRDREHFAWIDPFQREAWDYLLDLGAEAAAMGFDEIQYDYVRFPDSRGLLFSQPNTEANRVAAVTGFLQAAHRRLAPYNVFLAADVFGYTAWNNNDTSIGQNLAALSQAVDYLSPMLYPSGFQFGIPGAPDPVRQPYDIVLQTLQHAAARTGIAPLRFRPWLQAFRDYAFDRRPFDADEIRAQIHAAEQAGSDGWMLWNPRNSYSSEGLRQQE
ncbi:GTP-binding protein [Duganella ginsengisoli]|uniref:GTP-binding protein n=2 Tax=Pseudoduganella ginsengisoli TaxID=1462440 RepID=A0A6L6Q467_9BURK|nr:putative glycoside hydrolase [Pseudoduganella ginsengisoli]MTW04613.1 GTP-binding protein [Pseudoduganella ginsengisoli]